MRNHCEWRCRDKGIGAVDLANLSRSKGLTTVGGMHGNVELSPYGGGAVVSSVGLVLQAVGGRGGQLG